VRRSCRVLAQLEAEHRIKPEVRQARTMGVFNRVMLKSNGSRLGYSLFNSCLRPSFLRYGYF